MGVRHKTSNFRMVFRSIPPAEYKSDAVSWIAAIASLRNFLGILTLLRLYFDQRPIRDSLRNLVIGVSEDDARQLAEGLQLVVVDVAPVHFLEAIHKHGSPLRAEDNNCP